MLELLKNAVGIIKRGVKGRPVPARQSARLGLERLEVREVLSGFGTDALPVQTLAQPAGDVNQQVSGMYQTIANEVQTIQTLFQSYLHQFETIIYDYTHSVPDFTGVNFAMTSTTNGGQYSLAIGQQTDNFGGTASFTGMWGGNKPVTGTMSVELDGSTSITANWTGNGGGGNHTFTGTITGSPGAYQIVGDVVVENGGGPGHLTGQQV